MTRTPEVASRWGAYVCTASAPPYYLNRGWNWADGPLAPEPEGIQTPHSIRAEMWRRGLPALPDWMSLLLESDVADAMRATRYPCCGGKIDHDPLERCPAFFGRSYSYNVVWKTKLEAIPGGGETTYSPEAIQRRKLFGVIDGGKAPKRELPPFDPSKGGPLAS